MGPGSPRSLLAGIPSSLKRESMFAYVMCQIVKLAFDLALQSAGITPKVLRLREMDLPKAPISPTSFGYGI